jgi:hypothetical protein
MSPVDHPTRPRSLKPLVTDPVQVLGTRQVPRDTPGLEIRRLADALFGDTTSYTGMARSRADGAGFRDRSD